MTHKLSLQVVFLTTEAEHLGEEYPNLNEQTESAVISVESQISADIEEPVPVQGEISDYIPEQDLVPSDIAKEELQTAHEEPHETFQADSSLLLNETSLPPSELYRPTFNPPLRYSRRPRRKRGRPSYRSYDRLYQYTARKQQESIVNFHSPHNTRYSNGDTPSSSFDASSEPNFEANSIKKDILDKSGEENLIAESSFDSGVEESEMVGKSGEKGKGERKKVLEMMSLQFNSSDIPDQGSTSDDSKRGRRSSRVGRPPKRTLQNMEYSIKSSHSAISDAEQPSLASVNPTTHALKKIRKDKPEEISHFNQGEYDDLQKSGSEKDSGGEESNEFPDNVFGLNNSDLAVTAGRKRRGRISQSSHTLTTDGSSVNMRGFKNVRRGRGRSRGRADSFSPAVGRESPRSESSLDSFQSRQRRNPKHSLLEEYPSDLELQQDTISRGRGRGRSSVFLNSSRGRGRARVNQDPGSRRSTTPVIGEFEEMPSEEVKVKRSVGRPKKADDLTAVLTPTASLSVNSPAGSVGGQSTSSNKANSKKKKRKHFKGLKYSFVKKKKKPKAKPPNMSVDANPETESVASEDVDGDSFDSSSQVWQLLFEIFIYT
ncbi:hypothetical protein Anas_14462 [Armadillidium nasatum]|uniref:Uncharacterized protein n=1 Tax=Armadillidium nasatum TaxID=96803 RepID=A0A5N5T3I9_9CRUS|nr:hypothetical protein Anas_14462 [Armadillidium nasatum]